MVTHLETESKNIGNNLSFVNNKTIFELNTNWQLQFFFVYTFSFFFKPSYSKTNIYSNLSSIVNHYVMSNIVQICPLEMFQTQLFLVVTVLQT